MMTSGLLVEINAVAEKRVAWSIMCRKRCFMQNFKSIPKYSCNLAAIVNTIIGLWGMEGGGFLKI